MDTYQNEYRIAELIARKLTGVILPEEEAELSDWRNKRPVLFNRVLRDSNRKDRDYFVERLDIDEAWLKVKQKTVQFSRSRFRIQRMWQVAAAVAVLMTGIIAWQYLENEKLSESLLVANHLPGSKAVLITGKGKHYVLDQSVSEELSVSEGVLVSNCNGTAQYQVQDSVAGKFLEYNTVVVPRGGEYRLRLSDGTQVWLNAGSKLYFPVSFSKNCREVSLEGEAYMVVSRDSLRPFRVNVCNKMNVEVLGTEFNIQAYPEDQLTQTTLAEGSVCVILGGEKRTLKPDQQLVYNTNREEVEIREVAASRISAWRDGLFVFENETLEVIMDRLTRWYNIHVFYQHQRIKNYHFTGDLEKYKDVATSLRMIEMATRLHFEIKGNSVTVSEY